MMASGPLTTHFLSSYHSVLNLTAFQPYLHSHFLVPFDCCFSFTLPSLCFLSIFHSAQLSENSLHPIAKIQLCSGISTPKYHPNPSTSFHLHSPVQVSSILSQFLAPALPLLDAKMTSSCVCSFPLCSSYNLVFAQQPDKPFKQWI